MSKDVKFFYVNLTHVRNIGSLTYTVAKAVGRPVVLLNLSSRITNLNDLIKLSTYNYFWKQAEKAIYVGYHDINKKPIVTGKLNKMVFKTLLTRCIKFAMVGEKKMLDLRYLGKNIDKTLIAISNIFGYTKYVKECNRYGMDRRTCRDAFGLEMSYQMIDYDQINILVSKYVSYNQVKSFMKTMVFYKDLGGKVEHMSLNKIIAYYRQKEVLFHFDTYRDAIIETKQVDELKLAAYSKVFGVDFDLCRDEAEYLAIMQWYRHNYKDYVDLTIGANYLLNVAECYQDKWLAKIVYNALVAGTIKVSEYIDLTEYTVLNGFDLNQIEVYYEEAFGNEEFLDDEAYGTDDDYVIMVE